MRELTRRPQRVSRPQPQIRSRNAALTVRQLYSLLAKRLGLPVKTVREFFRELSSLMLRELRRSGEFEVPGVVRFVRQARKARVGRNPATGEAIRVPARTIFRARVSRDLTVVLVGERVPARAKKTAR